VIYEGVEYPSSEHGYQAGKSIYDEDRLMIKNCRTTAEAKKRAQEITLRDNWDEIRLEVMEDVLRSKFTLNPSLKEKLLNTGDKILIEGNHWNDTFWGIVLKTGKGENNLGKLLMKLRSELKK
jgi:ribA/ribD-fused uncharacterized protein